MGDSREAVYLFICNYWLDKKRSPSQDQIAAGCHLAPSTVRYHLSKLEAEGLIRIEKGQKCAIHIEHA